MHQLYSKLWAPRQFHHQIYEKLMNDLTLLYHRDQSVGHEIKDLMTRNIGHKIGGRPAEEGSYEIISTRYPFPKNHSDFLWEPMCIYREVSIIYEKSMNELTWLIIIRYTNNRKVRYTNKSGRKWNIWLFKYLTWLREKVGDLRS